MRYEIDRKFINKRIDKSRLLAPKDPKDLKKIKVEVHTKLDDLQNIEK